jgi:signal transduction histidine kinase
VVPMLAEVADLYGVVADERGVALEVETPAHVSAYGDRALIQQAVANMVDNAVKFSPIGGVVRLTATMAGSVVITVGDQGPGIPAAERDKATDRFYRGETARNTPGSGLGLSLVLAVAQLHGGTLRLEDNAPGLRAILTLPPPDDSAVTDSHALLPVHTGRTA